MGHWLFWAPLAVLWLSWLGYWIAAARDVKAVRRHESRGTRIVQIVATVLVGLLLGLPYQPLHWLEGRFWPPSLAAYWLGVALIAIGLAFAAWARVHLGRNWSGVVTVKEGHELVRSGPYGLVRHPIYSGMLLAILGTAIAIGQWRGLIAFAVLTLSFVLKLRTEERLMGETFPDQYPRYRAEVPALIPFTIWRHNADRPR